MRSIIFVIALAATGCKDVECGEGTIERNGACEPADVTIDPAKCGPNTVPQGDVCVPKFDPTRCDPASTEEDVDPMTNVVTCVGSGGGGCGSPIACPAPAAGKQTICGQLYNLENNEPFTVEGGGRCDPTMPAASGPCALRINVYDAVAFAMGSTTELATGDRYLDSCGRFRITDITPPNQFIALGIDDIQGSPGPSGVTNATGIAIPAAPNAANRDVEAFVVSAATTTKWAMTGGPTIANGIYVMIFRQKSAPSRLTQAGVTPLKGLPTSPMPTTATDSFFVNTDVQRERVDAAANVTGANGTALITPTALTDGGYSGVPTGVLPAECRWSAHASQTLPGVVFVQIVRPVNGTGTCTL